MRFPRVSRSPFSIKSFKNIVESTLKQLTRPVIFYILFRVLSLFLLNFKFSFANLEDYKQERIFFIWNSEPN